MQESVVQQLSGLYADHAASVGNENRTSLQDVDCSSKQLDSFMYKEIFKRSRGLLLFPKACGVAAEVDLTFSLRDAMAG